MDALRPLNYFSNPSFLQIDLKAGVLRSRGGTRLVGLSDDFLRGFVQACEHEAGPATALILRRCGYRFGLRLAQRCERELSSYLGRGLRDCSMLEFDTLISNLWQGLGFGSLSVDWSKGQHGILPVKLQDSPMQDIGPRGHIADDMFCGLIEGVVEHFSASPLGCIQTGDVRLGSKEGTTFVLAGPDVQPLIKQLVAEKLSHSAIVARISGG